MWIVTSFWPLKDAAVNLRRDVYREIFIDSVARKSLVDSVLAIHALLIFIACRRCITRNERPLAAATAKVRQAIFERKYWRRSAEKR